MKFENLRRWKEIYKCSQCQNTVHWGDTFVIFDRKVRKYRRFCRDCMVNFYREELKLKNLTPEIKQTVKEHIFKAKDVN